MEPTAAIASFDHANTHTFSLHHSIIRSIWSTDRSNHIIQGSLMANLPDPQDMIIFDIDSNTHPLFCSRIANDLFQNLLSNEDENRPRTDYLDSVQKQQITPQMRATCVDHFITAADKLSHTSDTIHLAINCWDRYLSGNEVDIEHLCLSGLTCLIIASKYVEIMSSVKLEDYVVLDNFSKWDYIQMEDSILNYLDYNVGNPTASSFLERFVRAAKVGKENPLQNLGSMASYIAELSLLSYPMLRFRPSMVAASCVLLALRVLCPCDKRPWTNTLKHYTGYRACDLCDCVMDLNELCYKIQITSMPDVRIKYSQDKYGRVGLMYFSLFPPEEIFQDSNIW